MQPVQSLVLSVLQSCVEDGWLVGEYDTSSLTWRVPKNFSHCLPGSPQRGLMCLFEQQSVRRLEHFLRRVYLQSDIAGPEPLFDSARCRFLSRRIVGSMNMGLEGHERAFRSILLEDVGDHVVSLPARSWTTLRLCYCGPY